MFQASRELNFSYAHRLPNYDGKCRHLHGHNARCMVVAQVDELGDDGMVQDFALIKKTIGQWIDDCLDHRTILFCHDPLVPILHEQGQPLFLMDCQPTAENLAQLIFQRAIDLGLPVVEVQLWENQSNCAIYRQDS